MSDKYLHDMWTRVAFPPTVADLAAPTLAEIGLGAPDDYYLEIYTEEYVGSTGWIYDIHTELTRDGLSLPVTTEVRDVTPWKGTARREIPTRYSYAGAELQAFRTKPPGSGILWHGSAIKSERVLVVRRGVPVRQVWASGDEVEVYRVITGHRSTARSAPATAVTFTVPLFVTAENQDAVVA